MKKIILILLLFSFNAFGQVYFSGTRQPLYSTRATQFFDRCVTAGVTLTTAQKQWYDDSIFTPLLDSGLIGTTRAGDSIQALWCFATFMADTVVLKLNLLSDSNICISVGTLTWTDSGVVTNGTNSYLKLGLNPTYDSTICKIYSYGMGFYSISTRAVSNSKVTMGVVLDYPDNFFIHRSYSGSYPQLISFYKSSVYVPGSDLDGYGYFYGGWVNSTTVYLRRIGLTQDKDFSYINADNTSVKLINLEIYFGALNDEKTAQNFDDGCFSFSFVTSGLSATKVRALGNILNNSLKGRGYNIW